MGGSIEAYLFFVASSNRLRIQWDTQEWARLYVMDFPEFWKLIGVRYIPMALIAIRFSYSIGTMSVSDSRGRTLNFSERLCDGGKRFDRSRTVRPSSTEFSTLGLTRFPFLGARSHLGSAGFRCQQVIIQRRVQNLP